MQSALGADGLDRVHDLGHGGLVRVELADLDETDGEQALAMAVAEDEGEPLDRVARLGAGATEDEALEAELIHGLGLHRDLDALDAPADGAEHLALDRLALGDAPGDADELDADGGLGRGHDEHLAQGPRQPRRRYREPDIRRWVGLPSIVRAAWCASRADLIFHRCAPRAARAAPSGE